MIAIDPSISRSTGGGESAGIAFGIVPPGAGDVTGLEWRRPSRRTTPYSRRRRARNTRMRNRLAVVLGPIFALTGFSALTLQVVWQRVISLHSGVDLASTITVVAAFLAGLGFGSLLGGWLADRLGPRRSLAMFAFANVGIGVFAWISLLLFYDLYRELVPHLSSTFASFCFNTA